MQPLPSNKERFGALRALLQRPASAHTWQELCQLYATTSTQHLTEPEQHYLHQHLARWPEDIPREADPSWLTLFTERQHTHPLLRWSNTLHLDWDRTRDTSLLTARLASNPRHFEELQTLTMSGEHLSMSEVSIPLLQPYARTLKLLGIQGPVLGTHDALSAFTSLINTNQPNLDHLLIAQTGLRPTIPARRLLQSPAGQALLSLDLSGNHLAASAGEFLQQTLSARHALGTLRLSECDLSHHAMAGMAMALRQAPELRRLDLGNNQLDDEALHDLFELSAGCPIEELDLMENATGVTSLDTLARSLSDLRKLSLNLPRRQHHVAVELEDEALSYGFDALEHLILGDNAFELWGFLFEDRDAFPSLEHLTIETLPRQEEQLERWVEDILDLELVELEILDLKLSEAHLDVLETLYDAHEHLFVRVVESEKRAKLIDELRELPFAAEVVQYVPSHAPYQSKKPHGLLVRHP